MVPRLRVLSWHRRWHSRENSLVDKIVAALWEVNRPRPGWVYTSWGSGTLLFMSSLEIKSLKKISSVCTWVVKTQLALLHFLLNKLLAWNLLSARTLRLSKTTSNRADHRLCLCQIISDDIMIINIKWVCNHPHWKPQAKPRSVLSVHKRQGKFRLQKDCNGFGFSLLLCRNVHSLEVPLIAPCWQLLLLQLCLRLQTQLSRSVDSLLLVVNLCFQ